MLHPRGMQWLSIEINSPVHSSDGKKCMLRERKMGGTAQLCSAQRRHFPIYSHLRIPVSNDLLAMGKGQRVQHEQSSLSYRVQTGLGCFLHAQAPPAGQGSLGSTERCAVSGGGGFWPVISKAG